jgi:hypothetical protein
MSTESSRAPGRSIFAVDKHCRSVSARTQAKRAFQRIVDNCLSCLRRIYNNIAKHRRSFLLQHRCCLKALLQKSDGGYKREYTGVSRLHGFFFILPYYEVVVTGKNMLGMKMRDPIPSDIRRACMLFNLQPEQLSIISGGRESYLVSARSQGRHHRTSIAPCTAFDVVRTRQARQQ